MNQDDAERHAGGCLCGALRYETAGAPDRIVFCHCRFCQRPTGTAYLLEAMFARSRFSLLAGTPARYELTSEGSGKRIGVNFCTRCGTKIYLDLDRVPNDIGLYTGTYDDPNWFDRFGANSKHIFLDSAQQGTLIHSGLPVYREHITSRDGAATTPVVFDQPHQVRRR
jgi:hypothetical protein